MLLFIFGILLLAFMYFDRKKIKVEKILFPFIYMVLYRTQIGLKLMDTISKKFPRLVSLFAFSSVIIGFIGMALIVVLLVKGTYGFLFAGAPPPVAPLFPGVKTVPGLPVLSFFHWIIAIFILAGVHEFSHGLIARLYNIKVKSSGFAVFSFLLPVIPAAFVEPDEEELSSRCKREQLGVLAAGSFSNLITAGIFFLIFAFFLGPFVASLTISEGVVVVSVLDEGPSDLAGVKANDKIKSVNGVDIVNVNGLIEQLSSVKPEDVVVLGTEDSKYDVLTIKGENDRGYLGISFAPEKQYLDPSYGFWGKILSWVSLLVFWVFAANLGVGLFNLLPMGPLDGGKMFFLASLYFFKNERIAKKVWIGVSIFCLALIVTSLAPFFGKLIGFIFGIFSGLI